MENTLKLQKKIFIKGIIKVLTGLHIGGNESSMEIGGVDNNIVKTGNGLPIIPGSTFKGKMRSLLAKVEGSGEVKNDSTTLKKIFGDSASKDKSYLTRIQVRDSELDTTAFENTFGKQHERQLDFDFSEIKTENVIKRASGSAEHPRQMERVPANALFNMGIVLSVYEGDDEIQFLRKIKQAFDLINMDYMGGSGSRGYGAVEINVTSISGKDISTEGVEDIEDLEAFHTVFKL